MADEHFRLLKRRQLHFDPHYPEAEQAAAAIDLLEDFAPVVEIAQRGPYSIAIVYDLLQVTLFEIEQALAEMGYRLDTGLLCRIRRALYRYSEETERANHFAAPRLDIAGNAQSVFVSRYLRRRHGCRDARPRHWREYL